MLLKELEDIVLVLRCWGVLKMVGDRVIIVEVGIGYQMDQFEKCHSQSPAKPRMSEPRRSQTSLSSKESLSIPDHAPDPDSQNDSYLTIDEGHRLKLLITPSQYQNQQLDEEQAQVIQYLNDERDQKIHERYLSAIKEQAPSSQITPTKSIKRVAEQIRSLPVKFRLSLPKKTQQEDKDQPQGSGSNIITQKAQVILQQSLQLSDAINLGQMDFQMAKRRILNLCERHLNMRQLVPKPLNKIGYLLLKNGLFCLLYILVFAEDSASKMELYQAFDERVQSFRIDFLENKAFEEDQLAVYSNSMSRRNSRSRSRDTDMPPPKRLSNTQSEHPPQPQDSDTKIEQQFGLKYSIGIVDNELVSYRRSTRLSRKKQNLEQQRARASLDRDQLRSQKRIVEQEEEYPVQKIFTDHRALNTLRSYVDGKKLISREDEELCKRILEVNKGKNIASQQSPVKSQPDDTLVTNSLPQQIPQQNQPQLQHPQDNKQPINRQNDIPRSREKTSLHISSVTVQPFSSQSQGRYSFHFKITKIIDPNVNGNGLFALLQIDSDIRKQLDSEYALVYLREKGESQDHRRRRLSMEKQKIWEDKQQVEQKYGPDIPIIAMTEQIEQVLSRFQQFKNN